MSKKNLITVASNPNDIKGKEVDVHFFQQVIEHIEINKEIDVMAVGV